MSKRSVNLLRNAMDPVMAMNVSTLTAASGVTVTTGGLTVTAGHTALRGTGFSKHQGAQATSADSTAAVTGANIFAGIIQCTPGAARAKATDTAANIISACGLTADNDSHDFAFINLATTASYIVTLSAGANVTLVGAMTIDPYVAGEDTSGSAMFRFRRTSATAGTLFRMS